MMRSRTLPLLVVAIALLLPGLAWAADEAAADSMPEATGTDEKTDLGEGGLTEEDVQAIEAKTTAKARRAAVSGHGVETYWGNEDLKEVVKGFFFNTRFGYNLYLMGGLQKATKSKNLGGFSFGGGLGGDILEKWLSVELDAIGTFAKAGVLDASGHVKDNAAVTGDFAALRLPLAINAKFYTTKRAELYIAVLGGLHYVKEAYAGWDAVNKKAKSAKRLDGVAGGRLGVEYYTGLRHFSIGFDFEIDYIIKAKSLSMALNPMLKYTF